MGNMVLDAYQQQSGNRIKVLPSDCNDRKRLNIRKPHVTLVPQKDGDTEIDLKTLRWEHMLCVLEFEKASSDSSAEKGGADVENHKRTPSDTRDSSADVLKTSTGALSLSRGYPNSSGITAPFANGSFRSSNTGFRFT